MPEPNGNQGKLSRFDRIEVAIEHIINEHEKFVDEHLRLLTAQVIMVDSVAKLSSNMDTMDERLGRRVDQIGVSLDAFINASDRNHREYHERLQRLEEKQ
jgi:hypothetical protein